MKNLILIALAIFVFACQPNTTNEIVIKENSSTDMPFIGHGAQWSAYHHADCETAEWGHLMTEEKWQMNFDRLDFMQPRIIRLLDQANWRYLKGFTPEGDAILDFESPEMQALYKVLDYCESRGIKVLIGEWGSPYKVHDLWRVPEHFNLTGADDPRWIEMIVEELDYLINTKKYTCIKYYNLVNEPNGSWAGTNGNWDQWSTGVKMLANRLRETGLDKQVSIAGPDAVPGKFNSEFTGEEWLTKSVDELNDDLGCYDIHNYPTSDFIFSGQFKKYYQPQIDKVKPTGKPFVFGELGSSRSNEKNQDRIKEDPYASTDSQMEVYDFSYGIQMADACIQAMNLGFGGIMVWDVDDAMHTLDDKGEKNQLKRWGFWNSLGTEICNDPADENIRPWFYAWSLMCRYFLPESNIMPVETGNENIHVVAGEKNGDYTFAITNIGDETFEFRLKTEKTLKLTGVKIYIYEEGAYVTDENGFAVPNQVYMKLNMSKGTVVSINPKSLIVLTSIGDN